MKVISLVLLLHRHRHILVLLIPILLLLALILQLRLFLLDVFFHHIDQLPLLRDPIQLLDLISLVQHLLMEILINAGIIRLPAADLSDKCHVLNSLAEFLLKACHDAFLLDLDFTSPLLDLWFFGLCQLGEPEIIRAFCVSPLQVSPEHNLILEVI